MAEPSQALLREFLDYNPLTGKLTWKHRDQRHFPTLRAYKTWNARYANKLAFTAAHPKGYFIGAIFDRPYRACRIIFKWMMGYDAQEIDHEDGNTQNDVWTNLRDIPKPEQQKNMKCNSKNTSGTQGVVWDASKNLWQARIDVKGKTLFLGRFVNKADAIAARQTAEIHYGYHPNHGR